MMPINSAHTYNCCYQFWTPEPQTQTPIKVKLWNLQLLVWDKATHNKHNACYKGCTCRVAQTPGKCVASSASSNWVASQIMQQSAEYVFLSAHIPINLQPTLRTNRCTWTDEGLQIHLHLTWKQKARRVYALLKCMYNARSLVRHVPYALHFAPISTLYPSPKPKLEP